MGCNSSKTTKGVVTNFNEKGNGTRLATRSSSNGVGDRHLGYNMLKVLKASEGSRFYDIYELQPGKLGEAAMGCIVRGALKKRTGEMFAVKTFMVSGVPSKSAQRRILGTLRNEIDMLRSLDHPNIIRAYESYEVGRDLHLVMELCRGGDLNARRCTEAQAAHVVRMVLSAILHSHQKGIIHRDLKFENILWESDAPDAQIKLIDFGMSARFQEGMPMSERVGSVYTMAPEVLEGNYTKQADLWSVGCITFHLIAGEPPFECNDEVETMKRLLAVRYYWPKGLKVSSEAKEFVYRLLKYDPRRRWTVEQAIASSWLHKHFPPSPKHKQQQQQQQSTEARVTPRPHPPPPSVEVFPEAAPSAESDPNAVAAKAVPNGAVELDPNPDSQSDPNAAESKPMGGTVENGNNGAADPATALEDKEAGLQEKGGMGGEEEEEEEEESFEQLQPVEDRLVSSMRSYRSYGVFRRVALMVVAYHQSPSKLTDLRNEFVDFDTEKNGEISRDEMQRALEKRGVGQEEREELFKSLDVDGSGKIQYLEFLAATIEAVGAADEEECLRHAFERLDTDDSGFITVANLKELVGPCCDDEALQKTVEDADLRKDGRVGWDEFLILMRGQQDNGDAVEERDRTAAEDSTMDG